MKPALTLLLICLFASPLWAEEPQLRPLMRHLGAQMYLFDEALTLKHAQDAARHARAIANHPKVALSQRKQIMQALGGRMKDFKGWDSKVHLLAEEAAQAAGEGNLRSAAALRVELAESCRGCHKQFRDQISNLLAP